VIDGDPRPAKKLPGLKQAVELARLNDKPEKQQEVIRGIAQAKYAQENITIFFSPSRRKYTEDQKFVT